MPTGKPLPSLPTTRMPFASSARRPSSLGIPLKRNGLRQVDEEPEPGGERLGARDGRAGDKAQIA